MSNKATILVADDDADIREVVGLVLESHGFSALTAADGSEVLSIAHARPDIALILLDLMMPVRSGAEAMTALKSDPALSQIPVIVLSGDNRAQAIASALGAEMCLTKPVDLHRLLAAIHQFAGDGRAPSHQK